MNGGGSDSAAGTAAASSPGGAGGMFPLRELPAACTKMTTEIGMLP